MWAGIAFRICLLEIVMATTITDIKLDDYETSRIENSTNPASEEISENELVIGNGTILDSKESKEHDCDRDNYTKVGLM